MSLVVAPDSGKSPASDWLTSHGINDGSGGSSAGVRIKEAGRELLGALRGRHRGKRPVNTSKVRRQVKGEGDQADDCRRALETGVLKSVLGIPGLILCWHWEIAMREKERMGRKRVLAVGDRSRWLTLLSMPPVPGFWSLLFHVVLSSSECRDCKLLQAVEAPSVVAKETYCEGDKQNGLLRPRPLTRLQVIFDRLCLAAC